MEIENNTNSAMMKEVARVRESAAAKASKGSSEDETTELPEGASPIEASAEASVPEETAPEETSAASEGDASAPDGDGDGDGAPAEEPEDEGPIRIGGQVFKTQSEAFAYAEQLERDKLLSDAHAQGVREVLEAQARAQGQPQQPEPEDDFEQRFYSDPKGTLKNLKAEATKEALAAIQAETHKEKLWSEFLSEYPDIRRKDAERILKENIDTIGKVTDVAAGKRLLAQKVRAEYEEIVGLSRPKTVLAAKKQVLSPSGGTPKGVTPQKKDDTPLSFAAQLKKLKGL